MTREVATERLLLRPFTLDDAAAHVRLYGDPDVTRWLGGGPFVGDRIQARSTTTLQRFVDHWRDRGFGVWAVLDRASGRFLGQCGLNTITELAEIEVLYALERGAWGGGLATEAARAALRYGFETAKLDRIVAIAKPDNVASRRVLEKCGLRFTRELVIWDTDAVQYGLDRASFLRGRP